MQIFILIKQGGAKIGDVSITDENAAFYGQANLKDGLKAGQPSFDIKKQDIDAKISLVDLYVQTKLSSSKSEARRLIKQGGAKIGDVSITDENAVLELKHFNNDEALLKSGKKKFVRLVLS